MTEEQKQFKAKADAFWADVEKYLGRDPLDKPISLYGVCEQISSMHRSIENQAAEDSHRLTRLAEKHGMVIVR